MARKTIFVSDLTGKPVDEKDAAVVTIRYSDARKGQVVLDVNADEVADLGAKASNRPGAGVGRRPQTSQAFSRVSTTPSPGSPGSHRVLDHLALPRQTCTE
jgi:hypothetical protein